MDMQAADIEKFVLWSLDHTGWYPNLWFPTVRRELINFPDGPSDDEIHGVLFQLIRNGSVSVSVPTGSKSVRTSDLSPEMLRDLQADRQPTYSLGLEDDIRRKLHSALERSRVPARGHFEVFAHGEEFDVNAYLKSAPLDFDNVWHRHESSQGTSGVGKRLGDGAVTSVGADANDQIKNFERRIMARFIALYLSAISAREQMAAATPDQMQAAICVDARYVSEPDRNNALAAERRKTIASAGRPRLHYFVAPNE